MSIEFHQATSGKVRVFTATVPDGTVVGLIGRDGSGKTRLMRMAAGFFSPVSGAVRVDQPRHCVGAAGALDFPPVRSLVIDHTFALHDAVARRRAQVDIERQRREGAAVLLLSHDEQLLAETCDELWWMDAGALRMRGNPAEVLEAWRRDVAVQLNNCAAGLTQALRPAMRRGDGRARLVQLETTGAAGTPTMVWASGEAVAVRVTVAFEQNVDEPVVGIMIRNRIGMEVYGTNSLLENLALGPRRAGDTIRVTFAFTCHLCPQEYTLTVASHDPDGVWHDWAEDALALLVTDTRYTAGVANLRATVSFEKLETNEQGN